MEADMAAIICLMIMAGVVGAVRSISGYWINPVSVYLVMWATATMAAYVNWLNLYPVNRLAWALIIMSGVAFVLGAATVMLTRSSVGIKSRSGDRQVVIKLRFEEIAPRIIVGISSLALIAVLYEWFQLIRAYGSVGNVFVSANAIYAARVAGTSTVSSIPYVSSLALCACAIGGVAIAWTRRLAPVYFLPLLIVILDSVAAMGRAGILVALALYVFPATMTGKSAAEPGYQASRLRGVLVLALIVFAGSNLIRDTRGGNEDYLLPDSHVLSALESVGLFRPSIYVYIAGPTTAFSESLHHDRDDLGRGEVAGVQTFGPLFRLVSRTGIIDRVSYYEQFVPLGVDRQMNVGTYLKDVYIDFGEIGCVVFAYLLGIIAMSMWMRAVKGLSMVYILTTPFVMTYVAMSAQMNLFRLGYFVIPMAVSAIVGVILGRKIRKL